MPYFHPSYAFMGLNTQPHPSKYLPKHVFFEFPTLKIGVVVPKCPSKPTQSHGVGWGRRVLYYLLYFLKTENYSSTWPWGGSSASSVGSVGPVVGGL